MTKKEYDKLYYIKNRDKKLKHQKQYAIEHSEEIALYKKQFYLENKEEINKYRRDWVSKDRTRINNQKNEYQKKRIKEDFDYKLKCILRSRIYKVIKGLQKTGSAIRDLGCTVQELKKHLEKRFVKGMTWKNYGKRGWHIDHIKPLSKFDLTNREQFLEACHYTNLQPLWWWENLEKSSN